MSVQGTSATRFATRSFQSKEYFVYRNKKGEIKISKNFSPLKKTAIEAIFTENISALIDLQKRAFASPQADVSIIAANCGYLLEKAAAKLEKSTKSDVLQANMRTFFDSMLKELLLSKRIDIDTFANSEDDLVEIDGEPVDFEEAAKFLEQVSEFNQHIEKLYESYLKMFDEGIYFPDDIAASLESVGSFYKEQFGELTQAMEDDSGFDVVSPKYTELFAQSQKKPLDVRKAELKKENDRWDKEWRSWTHEQIIQWWTQHKMHPKDRYSEEFKKLDEEENGQEAWVDVPLDGE